MDEILHQLETPPTPSEKLSHRGAANKDLAGITQPRMPARGGRGVRGVGEWGSGGAGERGSGGAGERGSGGVG